MASQRLFKTWLTRFRQFSAPCIYCLKKSYQQVVSTSNSSWWAGVKHSKHGVPEPHNCLRIANAVCVVMFINVFALEQKWYILRAAFLTLYTFLRILKAVHVVMFIKVFALIWMLFLFRCKIPLFLLFFPRVEHVKQRDRSISLQYASSANNAEIILEDCREGIKLN